MQHKFKHLFLLVSFFFLRIHLRKQTRISFTLYLDAMQKASQLDHLIESIDNSLWSRLQSINTTFVAWETQWFTVNSSKACFTPILSWLNQVFQPMCDLLTKDSEGAYGAYGAMQRLIITPNILGAIAWKGVVHFSYRLGNSFITICCFKTRNV